MLSLGRGELNTPWTREQTNFHPVFLTFLSPQTIQTEAVAARLERDVTRCEILLFSIESLLPLLTPRRRRHIKTSRQSSQEGKIPNQKKNKLIMQIQS